MARQETAAVAVAAAAAAPALRSSLPQVRQSCPRLVSFATAGGPICCSAAGRRGRYEAQSGVYEQYGQ